MQVVAEQDRSGTIVAVQGSVVDARFSGHPPMMHEMLLGGSDGRIIIEVAALTGPQSVRGLVLNPLAGLSLGMPVVRTGGPIMTPVGKSLLGRMVNMFGEPIDRKPPPEDVEWRSIHHRPVALGRRRVSARRSSRPASRRSTC